MLAASVSVSPVKTLSTTVTTTKASSTPSTVVPTSTYTSAVVPTSTYTSTTLTSNSSRTAFSDTASDIVDAEYVDKNIPKMELLKINYVSKSRNSFAASDESDLVQLRAKKRVHPKQMIRAHSDGVLKMSESAKLDAAPIPAQPTKRQAPVRPLPATPTTPATPATAPVQHHQHPLKYAVYKKHNSMDASALAKQEKLQYTNDEAFFKSRKKYLVFDGRKRNGLDNIQFYFDSKSYEQHVDNKMYGIVMNSPAADERRLSNGSGDTPRTPAINNDNQRHSASETKSTSWNFVKATRTLLHNAAIGKSTSNSKLTKNVPSTTTSVMSATSATSVPRATRKAVSHESMAPSVDVKRIGQLFKEARRASADDVLDAVQSDPLPAMTSSTKPTKTCASKSVKKLADDFENKCICDNTPRKTSLPTHLHAIPNASTATAAANKSNESNIKHRRRLEFPVPSADMSAKTSNVRRFEKSIDTAGFKLTSDGRSRSVINIDHGKPLFGHFQSNGNASNNSSTCGYKNCTFVNCPMSSVTAALSNVNNAIEKKCTKTPIESDEGGSNISSRSSGSSGSTSSGAGRKKSATPKISMTKIDTISNKSKLYLKTKDFNEDEDDEQLLDESLALNNLKNLKNSTIFSINDINGSTDGAGGNGTGSTTIPIKFTPSTQNLNNSIKCKSIEKLDFNSSSTFEDQKMNNVQPAANEAMTTSQRDDQNRVKIFIRNAPPAVSESSRQSTASSSEESTSDYYDSVPAEDDYVTSSANSAKRFEACSSPESGVPDEDLLTTLADAKATVPLSKSTSNLKNLFPSRFGCDGAIFWNDCYFYDEHACCGCKGTEIITDRNATVVQGKESGESCACRNTDDIDSFSDDTKQVENSTSNSIISFARNFKLYDCQT